MGITNQIDKLIKRIGLPFHGKITRDRFELNVPDKDPESILDEELICIDGIVQLDKSVDIDQAHSNLKLNVDLHAINTLYYGGDYIKDGDDFVYKNIGGTGYSGAVAPNFTSTAYGDTITDGDTVNWENLGEFIAVENVNWELKETGVNFGAIIENNGIPENCPVKIDYITNTKTYYEVDKHWDGGVFVIKAPNKYTVTTTPDEQVRGIEWRDYALMTTRESRIGGKALGPSHWIFFDDENIPWDVYLTIEKDDPANTVTIKLYLAGVFGYVDETENNYQYKRMDTLLDTYYINSSSIVSTLYTGDSDDVDIGLTTAMGISPTHDGRNCIYNVYNAARDGNTYISPTSHIQMRAYLGSINGIDEPVPTNSAYALYRLLAYFNISLSGTGNMTPDENGDYGDGITGNITHGSSREFFDNDPDQGMYPVASQDDAYLKMKRVYGDGITASWVEMRMVNYVFNGDDTWDDIEIHANGQLISYGTNGSGITYNFPRIADPTTFYIIGVGSVTTKMIYMDGSNTTMPFNSQQSFSYQPETQEWFTYTGDRYVNWA